MNNKDTLFLFIYLFSVFSLVGNLLFDCSHVGTWIQKNTGWFERLFYCGAARTSFLGHHTSIYEQTWPDPLNKPQNLFTRHSSRLCGPAARCKEQFLGYRLKSCTSRRTRLVFLFCDMTESTRFSGLKKVNHKTVLSLVFYNNNNNNNNNNF